MTQFNRNFPLGAVSKMIIYGDLLGVRKVDFGLANAYISQLISLSNPLRSSPIL